ncbi:MAG: PIN-like domain-containing protein, partial [Methanocella sp.]
MAFKDEFWQYNILTKEDISNISKNCLFVLDANVFLHLYRYSTNVREKFFTAINSVSDRVYVPYQASIEYLNNRMDTIR